LDRLRESIDDGQRVLVEQVIGLRPGDYGVDTPYAGDLEPVPSDLVTVSGQQYTEHGGQRTLRDKYVPRHVFEKYTALNDAFADEHPGRRLLIQSCYRSPAYQVAVFVSWLVTRYQGDIGQAIRHASPPGYSQHTIASKAAIDFKNVDGSPSDTDPGDFACTAEYAWLREHAVQFQVLRVLAAGQRVRHAGRAVALAVPARNSDSSLAAEIPRKAKSLAITGNQCDHGDKYRWE
jgi:hypothetical protein